MADRIAALTAFLTGVGSILGAMWTLKRVKRNERADCAQRIKEIHDSYQEGYGAGVKRRHE